jgi:hypothetical protein
VRLWNFRTEQYDEDVTIDDANVTDYYPENLILQNYYAIAREQGEQPIQAYQTILSMITWPQMG